jgi:anthranilate synthase component 2
VYRNDEFDIDEIAGFDKILLSWSWSSDEAGLLKDVIRKYGATKAFQVCLQQALVKS